jgi:hypothetical protein
MKYQIGDQVMVSCVGGDYPAVVKDYNSLEKTYIVRFDKNDEDSPYQYVENELKLITLVESYSI